MISLRTVVLTLYVHVRVSTSGQLSAVYSRHRGASARRKYPTHGYSNEGIGDDSPSQVEVEQPLYRQAC